MLPPEARDAPRISFPAMEGAPALARWLGLAPRFDVMAALAKGPLCYTKLLGKRRAGSIIQQVAGTLARAIGRRQQKEATG